MNGIIYPSAGAAFGLQTAMNARLGYPRPATSRGSACPPHPFGETTTCANVIPHPTLPQFALQETPEILAQESNVPIGAGVRAVLDATWIPLTATAEVG